MTGNSSVDDCDDTPKQSALPRARSFLPITVLEEVHFYKVTRGQEKNRRDKHLKQPPRHELRQSGGKAEDALRKVRDVTRASDVQLVAMVTSVRCTACSDGYQRQQQWWFRSLEEGAGEASDRSHARARTQSAVHVRVALRWARARADDCNPSPHPALGSRGRRRTVGPASRLADRCRRWEAASFYFSLSFSFRAPVAVRSSSSVHRCGRFLARHRSSFCERERERKKQFSITLVEDLPTFVGRGCSIVWLIPSATHTQTQKRLS